MNENFPASTTPVPSSPAQTRRSPDDPRRYPRYQLSLPVSIVVRDDAPRAPSHLNPTETARPETVCLQDISLTGLSFLADRPYPVDQTLAIQIALGDRPYALRVLVQRSQATMADGRTAYSIATLFVRGAEIHPFLAHLAAFLHRQPEVI